MTGGEFREHRLLMQLSQAHMASAMGMLQKDISRLETKGEGRTPTKQQVMHVLALLFLHENGLLELFMSRIEK